MRRVLVILLTIAYVGLTGNAYGQDTKKKSAPAPKVSAEMKDFMSYFNGDGQQTHPAVDK